MLAPIQQDAYDARVRQRSAYMSTRTPGLFGASRFLNEHGGRRKTPRHLLRDRAFLSYCTGTDAAPISTKEERELFNILMTNHPGVGCKGALEWPDFLDLWNNEVIEFLLRIVH
jgi:hypothetical protein